MLEWLNNHGTLLQATVGLITALVWIVYLQLFLFSFLRQRRPEILISRGAGVGFEARCFIANLSLEPIYISQLLMSVDTADNGTLHAAITDREAMSDDQIRDPKQATNQGPVRSGDSFDAGCFADMARRVLKANGCDEETSVKSFELTVVAQHAASSAFIGARRKYVTIKQDGREELAPTTLVTRQIRHIFGRWRLRRRLKRDLAWYRS